MRHRRARARAVCASFRPSCRRRGGAECDRELVGARQLFEVAERELLQEEGRRAVEQRASESLRAAGHLDQATLVQRLEHAADGDTANLLDLRATDGLAVRNERERLE